MIVRPLPGRVNEQPVDRNTLRDFELAELVGRQRPAIIIVVVDNVLPLSLLLWTTSCHYHCCCGQRPAIIVVVVDNVLPLSLLLLYELLSYGSLLL